MRVMTAMGAAVLATGLIANAAAAPERVALPEDYANTMTQYFSGERQNGEQYAVGFANDAALGSAESGGLADGSVLVMEVYKAKTDAAGEVVRDDAGALMPGDLAAIAVMEKREGWGADYPEDLRNGDWDYALYTPAGELKGNDATDCLACHKSQEANDFVFTLDRLAAK